VADPRLDEVLAELVREEMVRSDDDNNGGEAGGRRYRLS
jgi:hypothetical protein